MSHAKRLTSQKLYRNRHGDMFPVAALCKRSPNWRITLEDGRQFLVDPSTVLYVRTRGGKR
jgi:hypothetical protein